MSKIRLRRMTSLPAAFALLLALAPGCGEDPPASSVGGGGGGGNGGASASGNPSAGGAGGSGSDDTSCVRASGPGAEGTDVWHDGADQAKVAIERREGCSRSYVLSTTGPLRDGQPSNPRKVTELSGQPVLRSGSDMFDALYALALEETRECSVDAISDWAFNDGNPVPCAPGGCFETGRLWKYVWTRDTAYAMALGHATLDPVRAKNSLAFKTSKRRDGSDVQIVQDTGTGGSWPVSTDRTVWAIGARETLKWLDGEERTQFRDLAFEAMKNTAEHDRAVVWDPADGLYRGEQSFLDWREQSYPAWTAKDVVHIAMSKSLSTNVGHFALLDTLASLAAEKGDDAASQKYGGWATALKAAIRKRLYLPEMGSFSAFSTTQLDESPTRQLDLLGSALAVLEGVATPEEASAVVSSYPHLPKGPPVLFPQQKEVRIYHNRGIWPFVTAFWARAAAKAGNPKAIDNAARSLVRGAALNLSNMENFEAVSGANWFDDGPYSGPVVNSQRQLWSVAGYVSLVHDVVFGLEATQEGLRFSPKITRDMRRTLFAGADTIALSRFPWRGRKLSVVVRLPQVGEGDGLLEVVSVKVDGKDAGTGVLGPAELSPGEHRIDVELSEGSAKSPAFRLVSGDALADYKNIFGPKNPIITGLSVVSGKVQVSWSSNGESADEVRFTVYRDGVRVADDLPGQTSSWVDPESGDHATRTHCYSVEAIFAGSKNASQHASPSCYWGPSGARVKTFDAQKFASNGGTLVMNHGRWHYEGWGDPGHTLTVTNVVADSTGPHLFQVTAGNGAGDVSTGITCGVKALEVWDGDKLVASGQLVMPHQGSWSEWRDSNFVRADLVAGKSYAVVIRENERSGNMSAFAHFNLYGGTGGKGGRFNYVNIAELKLLSLGAP